MKKVISVLLVLLMVVSLITACGSEEKQVEVQTKADTIQEETVETTLSPRDQFAKQKEAMEELAKESEPQAVSSCNFTAGGITLQLDDSFIAQFDDGKELMTYWYSNGDSFSSTMKIGITPSANNSGYQTSQEAAEDIVAQKPEERAVECANGIYYVVQKGQINVIKAYYVDDSGFIWIVDGMTTSRANFDDYKDQLVQFCTSGVIN